MLKNMWRKIKFNYAKLMRSKGAAHTVAISYAVGVFIEFITLPTLGLAFFLMYPVVRWLKGSIAVSLIGFTFNKAIVPIFWVLDYKVGSYILNKKVVGPLPQHANLFDMLNVIYHHPSQILEVFGTLGQIFLVGSTINGLIMACVWYFAVLNAIKIYRASKEK